METIELKTWIVPAMTALFLWGFWGFLPKIATKYIDPKSALVFQAIGSLIVGLWVLIAFKDQIQWQANGAFWAIVTGLFGMLGSLFFLQAVSRGKVTTIVTITALYPLMSIALALIFLKEPLGLKQGLGAICALAAILLFSI
jgi:transporter family protein